MRIDYRISDLTPYINWVYFYFTWGVPARSGEAVRLRTEAEHMLKRMRPHVRVRCVVEILPAYSDGDDIIVSKMRMCECGQRHATGEKVRLPMLRQQKPGSDGCCLCLSDFINPKGDKIGVFATSVTNDAPTSDGNTNELMTQTLHDRLAEAAAEKLHEEVRKRLWGYAPNEQLTIDELHAEQFQGIRPAIGYPCLPDISLNFIINDLIDFDGIGVTLTSNGMMQPHASVSGLMISHPLSRYFSVGKIDEVQLSDYATRRGVMIDEVRKYLAANIH